MLCAIHAYAFRVAVRLAFMGMPRALPRFASRLWGCYSYYRGPPRVHGYAARIVAVIFASVGMPPALPVRFASVCMLLVLPACFASVGMLLVLPARFAFVGIAATQSRLRFGFVCLAFFLFRLYVTFDGREGFIADIILNLAGILRRSLGI